MAKIQIHDRVRRDRYVEAKVSHKDIHGPGGGPAHLEVDDILEFAKKLEEAEAPLHEIVVAEIHDSGLIKHLRVDWHEDTINGEPAPQIKEKAP